MQKGKIFLKNSLFVVLLIMLIMNVACIRIVPAAPTSSPTFPGITSTPTAPKLGNVLPIAQIDAILPAAATSGSTITFSGHGTDTDGTIIGYEWRSNIDGVLSSLQSFTSATLSVGTHIIYFKVKDSALEWSNEASSTVVITPKIANRPTIHTFTATPASITLGGAAMLNWSVSGANMVTIDGIGNVASSGMQTVYPSRTTYYTLTATNQAGSATATVLVEVYTTPQYYGQPIIEYFTPTLYGSFVRLSWKVINASSIYIDHGIGSVPATGYRDVASTGVYTLTATNAAGQSIAQITVYSQ